MRREPSRVSFLLCPTCVRLLLTDPKTPLKVGSEIELPAGHARAFPVETVFAGCRGIFI